MFRSLAGHGLFLFFVVDFIEQASRAIVSCIGQLLTPQAYRIWGTGAMRSIRCDISPVFCDIFY